MHKEICKVPRNSIFSGLRFDLKHHGVTVWLLWKQRRGPSLPAAKSISSDDQRWKIAFEGCQKISCVSLRSVRVRARVCAILCAQLFCQRKLMTIQDTRSCLNCIQLIHLISFVDLYKQACGRVNLVPDSPAECYCNLLIFFHCANSLRRSHKYSHDEVTMMK